MKLLYFRHSHAWFTLVELIVGMTVFAIGLTWILALLSNTMMNSLYSRHEIVISWILREQIELVKNIRDTNLENFVQWDKVLVDASTTTWDKRAYIIENDYSSSMLEFDSSAISTIPWTIKKSPVLVQDISSRISSDVWTNWLNFRLFLDDQWRYTHNPTATWTLYASYIRVSPIWYDNAWVFVPVQKDWKNQWYIIDARVILKNWNGFREYDAKTAITDWVK